MKRAVIQIRRHSKAKALVEAEAGQFSAAWKRGMPGDPVATFTFSSPSQLFSIISPKRWELIERLQAVGSSSVRGLARLLERDVKRVHEDVSLLIDWGIVEKDNAGKVHVPYDVIHADFDLRAVA